MISAYLLYLIFFLPRKNKDLFKQHTTRIDPRMKLEDAIEVAAEIGDVEILEGYPQTYCYECLLVH